MIISTFNNKGGSSKTTMNFQLATTLSKKKSKNNPDRCNKILLIDMDEQVNLTTTVLKKEVEENTIDKLIINDMFIEEGIITPISEYPDLDFIPGSRSLKAFDLFLNTKKVASESVLKKYFRKNKEVLNEYDYVIIDLSPSTNLVNLNAFLTFDKILIPIYFGMLDSLKGASSFMKSYKTDMEELEIEDIAQIVSFVNAYQAKDTKLSRGFSDKLENEHKDLKEIMLDTKIIESDVVRNAMMEGLSVEDYVVKNRISSKSVVNQIDELIDELIRKDVL